MSTPMPRDCKLVGLELYAPRRAAARPASASGDAPAPTAPDAPPISPSTTTPANNEPSPAPPTPPDAPPINPANAEPPSNGPANTGPPNSELRNKEPPAKNAQRSADDESLEAAQAQLEAAIRAAIILGRQRAAEPDLDVSAPRLPPAANLRVPEGEATGWPASPVSPASLSESPRRIRRGAPCTPSRRSRLDPEIVPEPPIDTRNRAVVPILVRYSAVLGFAALVAYGVTMISSPRPGGPSPEDASDQAAAIVAEPEPEPPPPRLVVEDRQALANEPMPLQVAVNNAAKNESIRFVGLTAGTRLSAGVPVGDSGWKLPVREAKDLFLYAPANFVGVMNPAVDLLTPQERLIDRQGVRLEWLVNKTPPPPQQQPDGRTDRDGSEPAVIRTMSREDAATLMKRGQDFLTTGDIAAARIVFKRLADAGIADGAFAEAATYDPRYLAEHHVVGIRSDATKARALYQRAMQLGSAEAGRVLAGMETK